MNLFHPTIIEKHTNQYSEIPANHLEIISSWKKGLREGRYDRETSHDAEFIQRIMIDVLGYRGSSDGESYDLQKNQPVGSGNVDVALGVFSGENIQIVAPFELKGAKTHNLDAVMPGRNKTPVQQAWEYAMDAKGAKWVLVSNYKLIRLYAVGYGRKNYEEFDLSKVDDIQNYNRLQLLLNAKNLLGSQTLSLLIESENRDKEITNLLYFDYKNLRSKMISELQKSNPNVSPLEIINITQTILDRILFVAFAEDRGLLPSETLQSCYLEKSKWSPQPAWDNFKALFRSVDKGNPPLNIPGYNGGLFADNNAINELLVSDDICEGFKKIGDYDFESEVSVNILGHIFEQSVSDLESLKSSVLNNDEVTPDNKSKRKKDGIFYTPPFITRQIVENTVGVWLEDRKREIGFEKLPVLNDEDYSSIQVITRGSKKGSVKYNSKIKKHIKAWELYKRDLSRIKVLDPACGSGAFLNEVFDYLLKEGSLVNDELATLNGGQGQLFRWDKHILSNNIYGVDLNLESVEITKLSLWLKTANKNEKLTYLDGNIKCGNSLIDETTVGHDRSFDWDDEFFADFDGSRFDVVLGNPPYGADLSKDEIAWLKGEYDSFEYQANTYVLFYERGINLLNKNGILGYITPNTFTYQHYFKNIRTLLTQYEIRSICKYAFPVFDDADIGDTVAFVLEKTERKKKLTKTLVCDDKSQTALPLQNHAYDDLLNSDGTYNLTAIALMSKVFKNTEPLGQCVYITAGVKPYQSGKGRPKQTKDVVKEKPFTIFGKTKSDFKQCIVGGDFHRYELMRVPQMQLKYGEWLAEPRSKAPFFDEEKIIIRQTSDKIIAHLDKSKSVNLNNVYNVGRPNEGLSLKYILGVLNSSLMLKVYRSISQEKGKLFAEVKKVYLSKIPLKIASKKQQAIIVDLVDTILTDKSKLRSASLKFLTMLNVELGIDKPSRVLDQWWLLDFANFVKTLEKAGKSLSVKEKASWYDFFNEEAASAMELHEKISETDNDIDNAVYSIYGVSPEDF